MTQPVRFLHHPTSQPCRAIHQFMLEVGIEFVDETVDIINGVNEKDDFKAEYNPTGQVPILVDGDFVVWESGAIASYLNERFNAPPQWFGEDVRQRAIIQQYLHWHSTTLRRGAGAFFYTHFAECIWGKRDYSREIAKGRYVLEESMDLLEKWLGQTAYLCGNKISFADLLGFHEFVSHEAGAIIAPETWARYPNTRRWYDAIDQRPLTAQVCGMIREVGKMRRQGILIEMHRKTSLAKGTEVDGAGTVGIPYAAA